MHHLLDRRWVDEKRQQGSGPAAAPAAAHIITMQHNQKAHDYMSS
jgi:hypothetical protein